MIKRLLLVVTLGVMLSGCFMLAPLALIGPVTSGYSTASIIQAGVSTGANYMVKQSTGKTITEHAIDARNKDIMQQTYLPKEHGAQDVKPISEILDRVVLTDGGFKLLFLFAVVLWRLGAIVKVLMKLNWI